MTAHPIPMYCARVGRSWKSSIDAKVPHSITPTLVNGKTTLACRPLRARAFTTKRAYHSSGCPTVNHPTQRKVAEVCLGNRCRSGMRIETTPALAVQSIGKTASVAGVTNVRWVAFKAMSIHAVPMNSTAGSHHAPRAPDGPFTNDAKNNPDDREHQTGPSPRSRSLVMHDGQRRAPLEPRSSYWRRCWPPHRTVER